MVGFDRFKNRVGMMMEVDQDFTYTVGREQLEEQAYDGPTADWERGLCAVIRQRTHTGTETGGEDHRSDRCCVFTLPLHLCSLSRRSVSERLSSLFRTLFPALSPGP